MSKTVRHVPGHPGWNFGCELRHASGAVTVYVSHEDGHAFSLHLQPDHVGYVSHERRELAAHLQIVKLEAQLAS